MTVRFTVPTRLVISAAIVVMVIVSLRTTAARTLIVDGLIEFAGIGERILRFPRRLLDHTHCFSLDRLDPTCPQCT